MSFEVMLVNNYFRKSLTYLYVGIIGYVGQDNLAGKLILDGIQILQYRGYDSCGICTVNEKGEFVLHKKSSSSGQGGDCIEVCSMFETC